MDLQNYFAALGEALTAGGMSAAQSAAYCKRLSATLENTDPAQLEQKLAGYGSPEELAKRVLAIKRRIASS